MATKASVAGSAGVAIRRAVRVPIAQFDVLLLLLVGALVAAVLAGGPWTTNDGPVHVAFAHLIDHLGDAGHPLQQRVYRLDTRLQPNLLGDLIIAGLLRLTTAAIAESVVQFLSLLGPMLASWLALRQLSRASGWLCIFVFIFSLNQLFFFGLYNFALSTAVFFLAVAAQYRLMAAPSMRGAGFLGGALALALLCHAGGFIAAWSGVAAMTLALVVAGVRRGLPAGAAVAGQRWSVIGLVVPLPLFAYTLLLNDGGRIVYGVKLVDRLTQFLSLYMLRLHSGLEPARIALLAAIVFAIAVTLRWAWRQRAAIAVDRRDRIAATTAAAVLSVVVMLAIPDTMGGGWTHFRRFEIFPLFWAVLLIAEFPASRSQHRAAGIVGIALAAVFGGAAFARTHIVRPQLSPLAEIDRLVGAHCTVLPLAIAWGTDDLMGQPFTYGPFVSPFSRLELTRDRVILANYLARLMVYPVHFRGAFEPQENLFHWRPQQEGNVLMPPDVAGYERRTGLHVDYVLVWGAPRNAPPAARPAIQALIASSRQVYATTSGPVSLYRRPGPAGGLCRG